MPPPGASKARATQGTKGRLRGPQADPICAGTLMIGGDLRPQGLDFWNPKGAIGASLRIVARIVAWQGTRGGWPSFSHSPHRRPLMAFSLAFSNPSAP